MSRVCPQYESVSKGDRNNMSRACPQYEIVSKGDRNNMSRACPKYESVSAKSPVVTRQIVYVVRRGREKDTYNPISWRMGNHWLCLTPLYAGAAFKKYVSVV